ncbi:ATP-binding protein [Paralimibaculum aggregatum]|uniref:histidine kinase n=1 Tax=Paralimibaculum aggregatum TaxID=3036245 RepID=A0ABQ6LKD7_9RHOB|nr:ATP-binding protein [Limibaculum sp. NKW23]GMG80871.1 ATP-binding protein [Limibaculum sp. NKW23]
MDVFELILLAGPSAALLGISAGVAVGDVRDRRRMDRLRARLEQAPHPSLLTRFSGRAIAANRAFEALAPMRAGIEATLGGCLERCGAAAIYRLSQGARRLGFAVLPVALRGSAEPRYLGVWAAEDGHLLWSLLTAEALAEAAPALVASPYQHAPFAHVAFGEGESPLVNTAFAQQFGRDPAPVLAALPGSARAEGDRVLLTRRDGHVGIYRAFLGETGGTQDPAEWAAPVPAAAAPGDGQAGGAGRELFLFPVAREGYARSGPTRVLELVPVALAQFETDGTLLWCNSRAREILSDRARPGANLTDLFVPLGQPGATLEAAALAAQPGGRGRGQMVQLKGADTFLQIALTRVSLYARETLIAVLTDASQLRQLEDQFAQSQKMEAVGKLAGGVAHDFNNVLTAIVGHCDLLLLRKDASHPDYSDLMQITQNANRAAALVRQLLAFSRKQTLKPEILSVQDVVSETHYMLNRLVGETTSLVLDIGPDLWFVRADHQQLEQVLLNLVVNARDAMRGTGTVTISVRNVTRDLREGAKREPAGDYVEIRITDTGPGIDPEVIDKVFDPFFTTKPKGEGTGLGLSTVYGIVKQSGGYIFAENAGGGGACFRILLPRASEQRPAPPEPVEAQQPRRDLTGRGSVLLVEDEHPVRAFAARALKLRGYEVAEAATAEDAMEILADPEFQVDLLVSDVVMPGMDGPTFAAKARQMRPGLRLIFVSGYAEESFRKNLTETDFHFLPKPFSLNELTAKVKEALAEMPVE